MGVKLTGGATLRFDSADAVLTCLTNFSFSSGTVSVAFGNGVSPSGGKTLVLWPDGSQAPAGTFVFANASLAANWDLCKTANGLIVKPKDRFDVPDTEAYIVHDSALDDWLDEQNFWMYEENNPGATWQDFLSENGENGYANWINYLLGLPTTDANAKVRATINFDEQGRVVVSVADALSNAPDVTTVKTVFTLYSTDDLSNWPSAGEAMDGPTAVKQRDGARRFYRIGISFSAPSGL